MIKKKNQPYLIAAIFTIIMSLVMLGVHQYNVQHMEGAYTGKFTLVGFKNIDRINFSTDKTFVEGDPKSNIHNQGTYEINGNKLILKWKKYDLKAVANLENNQDNFTIKSIKGFSDFNKDTKFKIDK